MEDTAVAAATQTEVVAMLVQEVEDLLELSPVGLYEFMWILHDQNLNADDKRACAEAALNKLLAQPGIELVTLRWPSSDVVTVLNTRDLPADRWDDPGRDGLYIAVNRRLR